MDSQNLKLLKEAIKSRNVETVNQILLVNPELCYSSGCEVTTPTPLWLAMLLGYEEIVRLLIEFGGADVNEWVLIKDDDDIDETKLSFFQWAALIRNDCLSVIKVSEVLIQFGAKINARHDPMTNLPIQISISQGNIRFLEFCLKNSVNFHESNWGYSPIPYVLEAPSTKQKEILRLLFQNGLNPRFRRQYTGENLMHLFVCFQNRKKCIAPLDLIEILLEFGVPLDEVHSRGYSPLEIAIYLKEFEVSSFLIRKGANVNKGCNENGSFPLSLAAYGGDVNLVDLLLSNGAKINAKKSKGKTALHEACRNGHVEVIKLLIQKGADVTAEDKYGFTPFRQLQSEKGINEACCVIMLKVISKFAFENLRVSKKDIDLIKKSPELLEYFDNCTTKLLQLKNTVFYFPYSYYSILQMSKRIKKLANLARNDRFVEEFEKNLTMFYYKDDSQKIFGKAIELKDKLLVVETRLKAIFGKVLPAVIIDILAENFNVDDLPLSV